MGVEIAAANVALGFQVDRACLGTRQVASCQVVGCLNGDRASICTLYCHVAGCYYLVGRCEYNLTASIDADACSVSGADTCE